MKEESITNNSKAPTSNVEMLKKHFSHCFDKDGGFDIDKFKQEISKEKDFDFSKESYGMDWLGKSYAQLLAVGESTTLLKENESWNQKKENINSENLLIKGDNLEVLKHLSNAYYEKIKMIYIDPPYNTGNDDFVYQDDRKFTVAELSRLAGIDEDKAKRILDFTKSKSNSHSAWLTFMYPRLYIAKQLLKDDGVMFVSIDDNEVTQLRLLMDEIFGEENFVANFVWSTKKAAQGMPTQNMIVSNHEYILIYSKEKESFNFLGLKRSEDTFSNPDNDKRGLWKRQYLQRLGQGLPIRTIVDPDTKKEYSFETPYTQEKLNQWIKENRILFPKDEVGYPARKEFLDEYKNNQQLITNLGLFATKATTEKLYGLFDGVKIFTNPKPDSLIRFLLEVATRESDLVLDFFAGSGTTGDAVMQLNAEDGGNRKYILVQLDEPMDPNNKKTKAAYAFVTKELKAEPTIFEITKERLIRVAKKIQEDNKDKDLSNMDFGFKIFETIPIWEDYQLIAEEFEESQKLFDGNSLKEEDLKTLLTTWKTYDGFSLTQNLKKIDLNGYTGHYLANKLYFVNKNFKTSHLKKLLEEIEANQDLNPSSIIVFGYNFESKSLREIADNVKNYTNKKQIDIDFITRY